MGQPIHAVIFDADGTLVDSEAPGLDVLHATATGLGLTWTRDEVHERFRGARMGVCVSALACAVNQAGEVFERDLLRQIRSDMTERFCQGLQAMPGAHDLLRSLRMPFCVATNGPREKVELTLTLTDLLPLVEGRIYTAYEVGSFKPEPGLFLHSANAMGVVPAHCAVVEDSLPGVEAGVAAGMQVFTLLPQADLPLAWREQVVCIPGLSELEAYFS